MEHRDIPTPSVPFTAKVIRRTCDHVDCKLVEATKITEAAPPLNTDSGWQLLPTIRSWSTSPPGSM